MSVPGREVVAVPDNASSQTVIPANHVVAGRLELASDGWAWYSIVDEHVTFAIAPEQLLIVQ